LSFNFAPGATNIIQMTTLKLPGILAAWGLPHSDAVTGPDVQFLWDFILGVAVFFTVLIVVLMVFFSIRYHAKTKNQVGDHGHTHNTALELTWSIIPLILLMIMFVLGFKYYLNMDTPPSGAYKIDVQAKQWSWTFVYPNGGISDKLYLPAGRPVRLDMTSSDVLHGFWIPRLSIQKDVVPGRVMTVWIEAKKPARMWLQCAEYCGSGHSKMRARVIVEPFAQFKKSVHAIADIWKQNGKTLSLAAVGRKLHITLGCIACHNMTGAPGGVGPTWKNLAGSKVHDTNGQVVVADYQYLKSAILHPGHLKVRGYPRGIMPNTFAAQLQKISPNGRALDALIAYINSQSKYANQQSLPPELRKSSTTVQPSAKPKSTPAKASGLPAAALPLAAKGKVLVQTFGCTGCHSVTGAPGVGPTWKDLAGSSVTLTNGKVVTADYKYLREMILHPGTLLVKGATAGVMPGTYGSMLSGAKHPHEKKLKAIIWYLNSLSDHANKASWPPGGGTKK
jgi:cytochrome c oxidase subunit 2